MPAGALERLRQPQGHRLGRRVPPRQLAHALQRGPVVPGQHEGVGLAEQRLGQTARRCRVVLLRLASEPPGGEGAGADLRARLLQQHVSLQRQGHGRVTGTQVREDRSDRVGLEAAGAEQARRHVERGRVTGAGPRRGRRRPRRVEGVDEAGGVREQRGEGRAAVGPHQRREQGPRCAAALGQPSRAVGDDEQAGQVEDVVPVPGQGLEPVQRRGRDGDDDGSGGDREELGRQHRWQRTRALRVGQDGTGQVELDLP